MRTLIGIVVSDKMKKTRVVEVTRIKQHPRYEKRYEATASFKAHDEREEYHAGDKVVIKEIRPMSKDKRWVIIGKSEAQNPKS
ncbi:MAG: 30S ribosomal protein S17 [Candidatus Brennerbacteria bacterium]|nr:30S ribosomal protein S17 [Candidatus Brennerbacteria bacterium]